MASVAQIIRRRRNRRTRRLQARSRRWFWWGASGVLAVGLVLIPTSIVAGVVVVAYGRAMNTLPQPQDTIFLEPRVGTTRIYDSSGQTLLFSVDDPLGNERTWLELDELPAYVWQATVLWEDSGFLTANHFDAAQVVSQLWTNWMTGPVEADYSLTSRLVRNVIVPEKDQMTVDDRALEIALVAEINRRYSPEEILEWHLNTNYYGNAAYGIEAAARVYLGKSARDLTLDEAVLLAAVPTAPQFNPVDDETAARGRQSDLLRRMLAAGYITQSQFQETIHVFTPILPNAGQTPLVAPEFAIYARRQAEQILSQMGLDGPQLVSRGGLRIVTTLDLDLYYQTDCILRAHLERLAGNTNPQVTALDGTACYGTAYLPSVDPIQADNPPDVGAVVVLDVESGEVRAMVGQATQVAYQPGPVLSPFVYLDGFINSNPTFTGATMLLDIPNHVFPGPSDGLIYQPQNPDGQFRGPISLRDAMGAGLLPPVVQVANVLNLSDVLRDTVYQMGITTLRGGVYDLSLLERGGAVSVLDTAYAYSIFAALGEARGFRAVQNNQARHEPVAVRRIEDQNGSVLWEYDDDQKALNRVGLLQREVAYLVDDILADQAARRITLGSGNPFELPRKVAAVNGVTGNRLDNWAVAYTPQIVTGIRLGRRDLTPFTLTPFGTEGAATVWRAVTDYIQARDSFPLIDWERPDAILSSPVCIISGGAPNGACDTRTEIFLDASLLPPTDTYWELVEINTETGQRATFNTPTTLRSSRAYFIPPQEAMDWWRANNRPLPPTESDVVSRPDIFSSATILQPDDLEEVGGIVQVMGSIDADNMRTYQLVYGAGHSPTAWINITEPQETFTPGTPLGAWDTRSLAEGTYVLQLIVVLDDGTRDSGFRTVIVDNIPPQLVLLAGEPGQLFRWPGDSVIPLVAQATDNIRLERVEFYHNGQFIASDLVYPFEYNHSISRPGTEVFTAVVFDAAGNSTSTEITVEVTRNSG